MNYSISSISNRDLQLLYQYRILRQPTDFLNAVYKETTPQILNFSNAFYEGPDPDTGEQMYGFHAQVSIPDGKVPMLEIQGTAAQPLAGLTTIDFASGDALLHSSYPNLGDLSFKVYWVSSFESIQELLKQYAEQLEELQERLKELEEREPEILEEEEETLKVEGLPGNLIKLGEKGDTLVDAEYRITGPVASQRIVDPTDKELAEMVKEVGGDILIQADKEVDHILQDLYGVGVIVLSGKGTWYLNNVTNDVQFRNFTGNVYAINCPSVRTFDTANIKTAVMIHSFLVHNQGTIKNLTLQQGAVAKQNSGTIERLAYVGAGCEYYAGMTNGDPSFDLKNMEGTLCLSNGDIWIHGKQVSFIAGHHDDPVQPSRVRVVVQPGYQDIGD